MFHIFSIVCFLIYGVNRRQVLIVFTFSFSDFTPFISLLAILCFFKKINDFENKIVPFGTGGTAGRQPGEPWRAAGSTAL